MNLDCLRDPTARVFVNPLLPLESPRISCQPGSNATLRVFTGAQCAAWRPDNQFGCFFDAQTQTFRGERCEDFGLDCSAIHLTDFLPSRKPVIRVASASQMLALEPEDIGTAAACAT